MMQNNDNAKPTTLPKTFSELNFASKEAYNLLRTNIVFSFPDSENGKVVGISSSCPAEGKSFTAINLAASLAEAGNTVLLAARPLQKHWASRFLPDFRIFLSATTKMWFTRA